MKIGNTNRGITNHVLQVQHNDMRCAQGIKFNEFYSIARVYNILTKQVLKRCTKTFNKTVQIGAKSIK